MTDITLTRDEAVAVGFELHWTLPGGEPVVEPHSSEACRTIVRRLSLEAAIHDGGVGWGEDGAVELDQYARHGNGECPESFPMSQEAAAALIDFLGEHARDILDDADADLEGLSLPGDIASVRRRRDAIAGLVSRLGVGAQAMAAPQLSEQPQMYAVPSVGPRGAT